MWTIRQQGDEETWQGACKGRRHGGVGEGGVVESEGAAAHARMANIDPGLGVDKNELCDKARRAGAMTQHILLMPTRRGSEQDWIKSHGGTRDFGVTAVAYCCCSPSSRASPASAITSSTTRGPSAITPPTTRGQGPTGELNESATTRARLILASAARRLAAANTTLVLILRSTCNSELIKEAA